MHVVSKYAFFQTIDLIQEGLYLRETKFWWCEEEGEGEGGGGGEKVHLLTNGSTFRDHG